MKKSWSNSDGLFNAGKKEEKRDSKNSSPNDGLFDLNSGKKKKKRKH